MSPDNSENRAQFLPEEGDPLERFRQRLERASRALEESTDPGVFLFLLKICVSSGIDPFDALDELKDQDK